MKFRALLGRVFRRNGHAAPQKAAALPTPARQVTRPTPPQSPKPVRPAAASPTGTPVKLPPAPPARAHAPSSPTTAPAPTTVQDGQLRLPLSALLGNFPVELQCLARADRIAGTMLAFPTKKIVAQLGQGLVRVSFGDIRRSAPEAFATGEEHDAEMVSLPPKELVKHLGPTMLQRRSQKTVDVPDDIAGPFGGNGSSPVELASLAEKVLTPPQVECRDAVPPVAVKYPSPGGVIPPAPTRAAPPALSHDAPAPADKPIPMPGFVELHVPEIQAPLTPRQSETPFAETAPEAGPVNVIPMSRIADVPAPAGEAVPPPTPEVERLTLPLASLTGRWPDLLKTEIAGWNLSQAQLALPLQEIEAGLKRGKISFTWETLRQAVTPAPPLSVSEHDALEVELPIATVAGAFLARRKKLEADRAREHVTPFPDLTETAIPLTPETVVAAAVRLNGVTGALIVLPDGLRVASRLDASLDADQYAAMLPQAYSMMRRWTKDMRFGELTDLTFTAGDRAWKILRVNGLFFGACGRRADELPVAQLTQLAARLRHWEGN